MGSSVRVKCLEAPMLEAKAILTGLAEYTVRVVECIFTVLDPTEVSVVALEHSATAEPSLVVPIA